MRTNLMRCFAVALGMSATAVPYAHAQYGQAPQASAFGNGFLTATGTNQFAQQQIRQPAAGRWSNFNAPAQPSSAAPQQPQQYQPYGALQQQMAPGRQVFRQVAQHDDDLLLSPGPSANGGPEQIAPGIAERMPQVQEPIQQQVPARGSYQPAPANQRGPAYESSPSDRQAPAYSQAPSQSYQQAPSQSYQQSQPYAPQADPYSNAPSMNYAPRESTVLDSSSVMPGSGGYYPVNPYANQYSSPYSTAMNSSWDEGCGTEASMSQFGHINASSRPALFPWFGGANALFLNTVDNGNNALAITGGYPSLYSNTLNPGIATGYEISAGRYLKCGTYGLGFTYFNFNPDSEQVLISGTAGNIRPSMQGYHDYHLDIDGAGAGVVDQVYNYVTGASGQTAGATNVRATRDLDVQGLEINLFSFGLMGYGRSTPMCGTGGCGVLGGLTSGCGFGRLGGPLTRPCANRVQIVTSHGMRWFQIRDDVELAYNIDNAAGYQAQDIYDNVSVKNNLYGYQFGGLLNYCISQNMNFNVGGKFGLYANDVDATRRVGTQTQTAYRLGALTDLAQTSYSDTVLATLGELNVGLGYRLGNAWTINGGYRVIGASGIATGFNQMAQDFGTSAYPGRVHANDSLLLHGAYVGANFNW